MIKGERIDITISMLAKQTPEGDAEVSDTEAEGIAREALHAARAVFNQYPLHFQRLSSGISIHGSVTRKHRVYGRRARCRAEHLDLGYCHRLQGHNGAHRSRRGTWGELDPRTETPSGGSGRAN